METVELTRFCLNPQSLRSRAIVQETWVKSMEGVWVRAAHAQLVGGLTASTRAQHILLTDEGRAALGLPPVPRMEESAVSSPTFPSTARVVSRGAARALDEDPPFASLLARAAEGW